MIRLNKPISVFLGVLFCLHIVNSFLNNDELLKSYKKKLTRKIKIEEGDKIVVYSEFNKNAEYYEICERPRETRAAICRHVIRYLRKKSIGNKSCKGYTNLYMNYLAFTIGEPCQTIRVWIDEEYRFAYQIVINCFTRSAIMSYEISIETTHLFQHIVIYPENNDTFLIFEYNPDRNYYILFDKYLINQWRKRNNVSNLLFSTLVPQSYSEVSNLFAILFPIHLQLEEYGRNNNNIVNSTNKVFAKMCYVAFRGENYKIKFNKYWSSIEKPSPKVLQATLRGPVHESDLPVSILVYTCQHSVVYNGPFISKYYIAAGPGDYSVILVEEMSSNHNDSPHYEIIEFIQNMTDNYLLLYFEHSY